MTSGKATGQSQIFSGRFELVLPTLNLYSSIQLLTFESCILAINLNCVFSLV